MRHESPEIMTKPQCKSVPLLPTGHSKHDPFSDWRVSDRCVRHEFQWLNNHLGPASPDSAFVSFCRRGYVCVCVTNVKCKINCTIFSRWCSSYSSFRFFLCCFGFVSFRSNLTPEHGTDFCLFGCRPVGDVGACFNKSARVRKREIERAPVNALVH